MSIREIRDCLVTVNPRLNHVQITFELRMDLSMKNMGSKKYFVKDEALHGIDNDKFHYADISKVLSDIIDTNSPPFNIAIIGKWGLGKSSLINLVTDRYKKQPQKYCVQEINAWKYEKESLRRVFLKQLWQGLNDNKKFHSFEVIKREILDVVNGELQEGPKKSRKAICDLLKILVAITLISVFSFIVYKAVQFQMDGKPYFTCEFWAWTFLGYCKNIGKVLFIPVIVAILTQLFNEYKQKKTQKFELNFPIETTDDYEIFLETKIKERLNEQKDLKIITVIDDLDRLSINKIVEALDALKAFVGFSGCIFIVPFDDEIIKQALDKRRANDFNDCDREEVVESELILDKLFQFKVYLPPLLDFDIQEYAISLAKQEIPDFLNEYCNEELMEKVIRRVLIHPSVSTPRQVKKLLNAFVNNYMVAFAREQSGKIAKGLLTSENGTMQIAKISVLQADFNGFYDLLFKDMSCLTQMLAYHRGEKEGEIIPYLQPYFNLTKKLDDTQSEQSFYELKSEYEPLANFLIRTEKYKVPSIAPYLYLAQDEISIKTGDELQRRVTQALVSGNAPTVKALLEKNAEIAEVIIRNVVNESENISETISVAVSVFDSISSDFKSQLAQAIIERTLELTKTDCNVLYSVSPDNIFEIAKIGENSEFSRNFIAAYLSVFPIHENLDEKLFITALKTISKHYPEFTSDLREQLHAITEFAINESAISAADLLQCVDPNEGEKFDYLWGLPWYKKLCEYIDTESCFSDDIISCLENTFVSLVRTASANELVRPLIPLSKYAAFLSMLAKLLNIKQGDVIIKSMLSAGDATQIAENVIAHDFSQNGSVICSALTNLPYQITEDNCKLFDDFLPYFQESEELDEVIIYCAKQNFFEILPKTTETLITAIFENEECDTLLGKTFGYFTVSMISKIFDKLKNRCVYRANTDYNRDLSIIQIIANSKTCTEKLERLMNDTLRPQLASYYNQSTYLEFVSNACAAIKDSMSNDAMNNYVAVLLNNVFPNNQRGALIAIKKISGAIPLHGFQNIYNKIIGNCSASAFDDALEVIIDNDDMRPKEAQNLTAYLGFLKKNLTTTTDPNRVLKVLIQAFSEIPQIDQVVIAALKNKAVSLDELSHLVAHFLGKMENQDDISATILGLYKAENGENIVEHALSELGDVSRILSVLSPAPNKDELHSLSNLAAIYLSVPEGRHLLLKCLSTSVSEINLVESTTEILDIMLENKKQLMADSNFKEKFIKITKETFANTDSVALKEKILLLVNAFKIKSIFKRGLEGESLEFFKKYTS